VPSEIRAFGNASHDSSAEILSIRVRGEIHLRRPLAVDIVYGMIFKTRNRRYGVSVRAQIEKAAGKQEESGHRDKDADASHTLLFAE
jgi:hypothetical protein